MMNTERRNARRAFVLLVGALLALPAVAVAQQREQHRHGQEREARRGEMAGMMMGMERHERMMGTMGMMAGPSPAMILRQKEALDLTEEQVRELEALQERLAETRTGHTETMQTLHRRLAEQAKDADLDLAAYESTLRSLADQHVAMHVAMARAGQEARQMLTPEQREKLRIGMQFTRGAMMQMMGSRMDRMEAGGGMGSMMGRMSCPMMGGSAHPSP